MINTISFSYEILAAALVLGFVILLCFEYLWLYIVSRKNEEIFRTKSEINMNIHAMLESVLNSPTDSARDSETNSLIEYMGEDYAKLDEAAIQIQQISRRSDALSDRKCESLSRIYQAVNPIELYSERLENGDNYTKGYACRQLAEFGAADKTENIRSLLSSKNKELVYNASMALSLLGDEESIVAFAHKCESNRKYSHRVLLELFQSYTGDRESLARRVFGECNDYIKANCIKAFSNDCIKALSDIYIENMSSTNSQLKIAAVKAIALMGNPEHEHNLIIALNDKDWVVRLAAVKGIEKIGSEAGIAALIDAVRDEEWWVRKEAAEAIVKLDVNLFYVEKVLSGYDKYAADAVKNALYKAIRMNGGDLS